MKRQERQPLGAVLHALEAPEPHLSVEFASAACGDKQCHQATGEEAGSGYNPSVHVATLPPRARCAA